MAATQVPNPSLTSFWTFVPASPHRFESLIVRQLLQLPALHRTTIGWAANRGTASSKSVVL